MPAALISPHTAACILDDLRDAAQAKPAPDVVRAISALDARAISALDAKRAALETQSAREFLSRCTLTPPAALYLEAWGVALALMESARDQDTLDHMLIVAVFVQRALYAHTTFVDGGLGVIERIYRQRRYALRYGPLPASPPPPPPVVWAEPDDLPF